MSQAFQTSFRAPYNPHPDQELLEELRASPSNVKDAIKLKARKDRYFLAKGILGYTDVNEYTHGPMCRALEDKSKQRRMYLSPRGHLKTTLGTITDSIGEALDNPLTYTCLIVNEIIENAQNFLSEIKGHFQTNILLHELFPDLIPEKFGGPGSRWGTNRACLRRVGSNEREWTWTVIGVGGAIVSRHFKHIKCDDLIGFEASRSPAAMAFAIAYAKALEPLLTNMEEDYIDFVGTRWAIYDLYREILNLYGDDISYFAREDIERVPFEVSDELLRSAQFRAENLDEIRGTEQPIFPKKFSLKGLRRMEQIDPVLYFAQYKNNPIADGLKDFQEAKLNWFDFDRWGNVVFKDQVSGLYLRWKMEELDIVMVADPNSGELTAPDFPAIGVLGFSPRDQVFALEMWSRRVGPDAFVDQIFDIWKVWEPRGLRVVGIEKAGQQTSGFYFKKKMRELKLDHFNVIDLKPANRKKPDRIRKALQPVINLGNFYVQKHQTTLRHQIRFHPNLSNDDELDCAAYATEITIKPHTLEERDEEEKMEQKILAARSTVTGYGK